MEAESGESSMEEAELESPRSVVVQMKKKAETLVLHSQVLRIREEDSHLGEDFIAATNNNQVVLGGDAVGGVMSENNTGPRRVNVILASKPILPSSPLKKGMR
ncbi:Ribosomal protein S4 [Hibiscus syriacus]|uniref:Ribosomal protein S4 n=1 Tax=Hibiscus syriacus TaxID=106335 RepID=A0A6A2YE87_HIBSY|nr:Ribosomal protein S4 [Hibiscus syriacus]